MSGNAQKRQAQITLWLFVSAVILFAIIAFLHNADHINELSTKYKPIVDIVGGLATPLIAAIVGYIAWRQHLTDKRRLQLERYERLIIVYKAVSEFINELNHYENGMPSHDVLNNLSNALAETDFLFDGDDMPLHLRSIRRAGLRLMKYRTILRDPTASIDEKTQASKRINELELHFLACYPGDLKERFKKYLRLQ